VKLAGSWPPESLGSNTLALSYSARILSSLFCFCFPETVPQTRGHRVLLNRNFRSALRKMEKI